MIFIVCFWIKEFVLAQFVVVPADLAFIHSFGLLLIRLKTENL